MRTAGTVATAFRGALLCAVVACAPPAVPRGRDAWIEPEDPRRDAMPATRAILDALSPRPGETVGDIGAGGGYFTFKIARLVGPEGKVVATDSDPDCVRLIADRAEARDVGNVVAVRVDPDEVGVEGAFDKVLMVNLFYFTDPGETREYFEGLHERLAPEGRVVIYQDETGCPAEDSGGGWNGCVLSGDEMAAALRGPFRFVRTSGFGARGEPYLLVLTKDAAR